jgi:hypothetical protein
MAAEFNSSEYMDVPADDSVDDSVDDSTNHSAEDSAEDSVEDSSVYTQVFHNQDNTEIINLLNYSRSLNPERFNYRVVSIYRPL